MTIPFRRLAAVLVLAAHPAALLAQDGRAGEVRKVSDPEGREVPYPTRLAEVMSATAVARAIAPQAPVASGEAVLTKGALTHVRMTPGQPEAVLFANTLVRFDAVNQWLLRNGAAFIVNRRGKLAVVVEGLETLFVGSEVYVEKTDAGLLAYVIEGSVRVGATGVALGPGQAARVAPGSSPQRMELSSADRARVVRQIELARGVMGAPSIAPGGGRGGAVAVGVVLGLGAAGAGVYLLTKDDAQADLVPVPNAGGAVCGFDAQQRPIVRVANRGEGAAAASSTRIASPRGGTVMLPTPALAAGATAVLAVPTNALCLCPVQLTADAGGAVAETDEQNNELQQACSPVGVSR
jgi:CARDB